MKAGVNLMNKTAIASLIGCLVVILPLHAEDIYIVRRFKAIESNPIPRDEYFVLLRKTVLNSCYKARNYHNLSDDECIKIVNERIGVCDKKFYRLTPAIVSKKSIHLKIAYSYDDCVMPGVFCYGIEVKTMEQFYRHCQDPNAVPSG